MSNWKPGRAWYVESDPKRWYFEIISTIGKKPLLQKLKFCDDGMARTESIHQSEFDNVVRYNKDLKETNTAELGATIIDFIQYQNSKEKSFGIIRTIATKAPTFT